MKIDALFMEFYLKMTYKKGLKEYFGVSSQICSAWRRRNKIPDNKILLFIDREGTIDVNDLFKRIYK